METTDSINPGLTEERTVVVRVEPPATFAAITASDRLDVVLPEASRRLARLAHLANRRVWIE